MRTSTEEQRFVRVVQRFAPEGRLLRAWALQGGVSARVTALEIERPGGGSETLLLRQHGEADRASNPQIAADEFRLLELLHAAGVPVPRPFSLDQSGDILDTPYIVIEYIEGQTEFGPASVQDYIVQLAEQLARIHQIDGTKLDIAFLPAREERFTRDLRERPAQVDASLDEGRLRDVLEAAWPLTQRNPSVLLHGDYWPGNVLWRDGALVGIIDWEDAGIGDPLADVGNSRLEILWSLGTDAMRAFTERYQALTAWDVANLPYWDLCAALRLRRFPEWAADAAAEQTKREQYRWFITQACERLSI
jgi:aminoglycoside phosphotransferase (APT) family kinase protein